MRAFKHQPNLFAFFQDLKFQVKDRVNAGKKVPFLAPRGSQILAHRCPWDSLLPPHTTSAPTQIPGHQVP